MFFPGTAAVASEMAQGCVRRTPKADVHRLRDGKVVDFMEFYDTAAAIGATT
jgi:ketosteroid isomerase-like protein